MKLRLFTVIEAPMAELTEQQRTLQRLVQEIGKLGGFVVSVPLHNPIRFQVLDSNHEPIIATLKEWGWEPQLCSAGLRFCPNGAQPCMTYQIQLAPERQPVFDDRIIRGELASEDRKRSDVELEAMRRYLGIGGKK
jgi:hypothetical protein